MKKLHVEVYSNLESIIQKLDHRINLKLFAIVLDEAGNKKACRVNRIFSEQHGNKNPIITDELNKPEEVFTKLGFANKDWCSELVQLMENPVLFDFKSISQQGQRFTDSHNISGMGASQAISDEHSELGLETKTDLFYASRFDVEMNEAQIKITYIISLQYVDTDTRFLFDKYPSLSFLRMVLDYYFLDYYEHDSSTLHYKMKGDTLSKKYREDSPQFLQRMTRLYIGKLENFNINGNRLNTLSEIDFHAKHRFDPQYYVNHLFEKIDGISTRTYEGGSPFGCMLILNQDGLQNENLISYVIQFQGLQNRILFEDARRIRKLLELTNNESDLYLIADHQAVYGVGKLDWSEVEDSLLLKVEFKGLSRYDVQLLTVEEKKAPEAHMVASKQKKIYKQTMNYEIFPYTLMSISFKRPGATDGGYTSERFRIILKSQFDKPGMPLAEDAIEKLQLIVQKAKEQQTGTMIVIAERLTAESELKILRKQSTLIKPTEINPELIRYFTTIDGAVYLDSSGMCHAIGVILDGLAQEHLGDSSRGARYHSAFRYLDKLLRDPEEEKKSVIAIISEDGTVDLIPEPPNEANVRQLVSDYVGYLQDGSDVNQDKLDEYDHRLETISETLIDHYHYFVIGDALFNKKQYIQAANYYHKGLQLSGQFYVKYSRAHALSWLRYALDKKEKEFFVETFQYFDNLLNNTESSEVELDDYNCRAITLHWLGYFEKDPKRQSYYERALQDYQEAINIRETTTLFTNRALLYESMSRDVDALNDFITAELISNQANHIEKIMTLVKKEIPYYLHALTFYNNNKTNKRNSPQLLSALKEYGESLKVEDKEVAAALQDMNVE